MMQRPHGSLAAQAAFVALVAAACGGTTVEGQRADLFVVQRGNLSIRITEQAELLASKSTRIKNEMEGQTTIIWLIEEGKQVQPGDKLVELDASELLERKAQQGIALHRAEAEKTSAEKELEIRIREYEAEKLGGENKMKMAEIDLEKFLGKLEADGTRDMGEREQTLIEAQANIELAEQEMLLARNKLDWSTKLHEKGFVTKDELQRDELDYQRSVKNVRVAKNELDILVKFTHQKELIGYEQAIREARTGLEGIVARGEARVVQARAELEARQKEYELALERYQNLERQIAAAVIRAPSRGLVIYNTENGGMRGGSEFVEEGATVRERQTLIVLPDFSRMIAELKVHEAVIDQVREGQRALVRVDTFPDREFHGFVRRISPVADSGSRWSNNSLKVYKTEVEITEEVPELKPGMSASVSIIVADLENVVYAPLQSIRRQGSVPYVWVETPKGPVARQVTIGLKDFQFVEVTSGLAEGDRVYLAAPDAVPPTFPQPPQAAAPAPPPSPAHREREASGDEAESAVEDGTPRPPGGPAAEDRRRGGSAMRAMQELLERKYPDLAKQVAADRSAWFTNTELQQALEEDPELRAARDALMQEFQRRSGEGETGERGERGERAERPTPSDAGSSDRGH
jgi:HlyD family secretion protein